MYKHKQTGIIARVYPNDDYYTANINNQIFHFPKSIIENSNDWKERVMKDELGNDLFEGECVYLIDSLSRITPFVLGTVSISNVVFKYKEDAKQYKLLNSKMLSLNDIEDCIGINDYDKLMKLVKSRI